MEKYELTFELLVRVHPLLVAAELNETLQHSNGVVSERHLEAEISEHRVNFFLLLAVDASRPVSLVSSEETLTEGSKGQDSPVLSFRGSDHQAPSSASSSCRHRSPSCKHGHKRRLLTNRLQHLQCSHYSVSGFKG